MTIVLTPILKTSTSEKMNNSHPASHVTFNLPDESNIVEYLKSENNHVSYATKLNILIKRITHPSTEDEILIRWIQNFKDNILFLENNERIAFALLNLNWYAKDDKFVNVYQDFILNIVTAHPSLIKHVLSMILKIFQTVEDADDNINENEARHFQNAHKLLYNVIKLVPSCENLLCILISEKFPYMKNSAKVLLSYIQNLLHLSSYFPSKRLTVLECIMEKLIHIDVNCSRSVIESSEMQQEEETNLLMDEDASQNSLDKSKMVNPLAHTLDMILDALYQFINKSCFPNGDNKLDWDATKKLYKEFLTVFDKIILPTHGSCHCQYIMFYICSFKSELAEGFVDYLWKKVQNPSIGPVFRQMAAFYIGSFLSRAKYINISTVMTCLELMCWWIHSYIDNHTSQELNVHGTFHSVCQTVFYVFAFRSQELLEADKGLQFLRTLNFDRIVTCRLNPLRYCDKTIVHNFANIARNFQVAYVYPVLEKNNRNLLYSTQEQNVENYCAGAMIQTFFPFDPYLLKKSKKWIEQNYQEYSHCQKEDESMDTVDEDDTEISDSLFSYGTSPGFKKTYLFKR